ncbi:hypothetical protein [Niveibacterium sp. SC-1]|uniref:hypothetical protein n=1 Tax=Niveibacterium sp. SC-1 TaxID=3135646 RepID=UPI00311E8967
MKSARCVLRVLPDAVLLVREERETWRGPYRETARSLLALRTESELPELLPRMLASEAAGVRKVAVVIADGFCRYLCLERPAGTRSMHDLEALARMRFQASFGDSPEDWLFHSDRSVFAHQDLVVAVSRPFLRALEAGLAAAGKRASGVIPFWIHCANASGLERRGAHWVVASEPGTHVLGLFDGHRCVGVRRMRHASGDALDTLIAREQSLYPSLETARVSAWGERLAPAATRVAQLVHADAPPGVPALGTQTAPARRVA